MKSPTQPFFYEHPRPQVLYLKFESNLVPWSEKTFQQKVATCVSDTKKMFDELLIFCDGFIEPLGIQVWLTSVIESPGEERPSGYPYYRYIMKKDAPAEVSLPAPRQDPDYPELIVVDRIDATTLDAEIESMLSLATTNLPATLEYFTVDVARVKISNQATELKIVNGQLEVWSDERRDCRYLMHYPVEVIGNDVWMSGPTARYGSYSPISVGLSNETNSLQLDLSLSLFKEGGLSGAALLEERLNKMRARGWRDEPQK